MIYYVNFLLPVYQKVALSDFDVTLMMNVDIAIQLTLTCLKSTKETLKKRCEICSKLIIKTQELTSITPFWCFYC